jgi:hypothetical protein
VLHGQRCVVGVRHQLAARFRLAAELREELPARRAVGQGSRQSA